MTDPALPFEHERLDVYQCCLEFVGLAAEVIAAFPRGKTGLADQLDRAATSILFNTAEGCGEYSRREKARFYRMALRSAAESSAILDAGQRMRTISGARYERGKLLLGRLAAMLTALVNKDDRA